MEGKIQYDNQTGILTIDGVRISAELIRAVFTAPGRRRHVIFEPDGSTRFLSSEPVGDTIVYTEHLAPAESWW